MFSANVCSTVTGWLRFDECPEVRLSPDCMQHHVDPGRISREGRPAWTLNHTYQQCYRGGKKRVRDIIMTMHFAKRRSGQESLPRNLRGWVPGVGGLLWLILCVLPCSFPSPALAQPQQPSIVQGTDSAQDARGKGASAGAQPDQQLPGSISGTVVDPAGAVTVGAHVQLARDDQSAKQEILSGDNGQFSFANLPPGPFQITITAPGFATHVSSVVLGPGQAYILPEIMLALPTPVTEVRVSLSQVEVAEEQIKEQEKQRVLGFIPNFYVTYVPDAAPLSPKQKFELAWKSVSDPITIVGVGALAGIQQAADQYGGYGQGAAGYGRRFGATYGDVFIGTFIDSAVLTSLLKQDPRYFYRGTGTTRSRLLYALGNSVMCRGDNKRYQPNYSAILGSFATTGISFLYLPASDRSAELYFQNSLVRIATGSLAGIFQEFVVRKLTPRLKTHPPPQP